LFQIQFIRIIREVRKKEFMESLTNCKMIMRYGAGFDNIDLEAAKQRGDKHFHNVGSRALRELEGIARERGKQ